MQPKDKRKLKSLTNFIKGEKPKTLGNLLSDLPIADLVEKPDHEWNGTALRFETPDGEWGEGVDLKGEKGDKGEVGPVPVKGVDFNDGYTPVKGIDYFDGIDGYTPIKGVDYKDGKDGYTPIKGIDYNDGKDGSPDTAEQIVTKINALESVIDAKTIRGLDNIIKPINDRITSISNAPSVKGPIDQRWHGGGLSKVFTDTTLTGQGTAASPLKVVGGGGAGITSINTDTTLAQTLTIGTTGTDFAIVDNGTGDHKFNLPTASSTVRGALSTSDWTTFNEKQAAYTNLTSIGSLANSTGWLHNDGSGNFAYSTPSLSGYLQNNIGISGGTTLIGGTGTTDNLTLQTTSGVGATGATMNFKVGNNGATTAMTILNNGNVGIGTTAPQDLLHIEKAVNPAVYLVQSDAAANEKAWYFSPQGGAMYWGANNDAYNFGTNYAKISRTGNSVTQFELMTNATGGTAMTIKSTGNVGIGTTAPTGSLDVRTTANSEAIIGVTTRTSGTNYGVDGEALGSGATTNVGGYFDANGATNNYGLIVNRGNVGIGTTGPGRKFVVYDASNPFVQVVNSTTGSGVSDGGYMTISGSDMLIGNQESGGLLKLFVDNDGAKGITIKAGNVGIGTTAPTAVLHLKAGTATANTSPLKFTSGVNLTTAEAGSMEYDGTNFYLSPSTTRYMIPLATGTSANTLLFTTTGSTTLTLPTSGTLLTTTGSAASLTSFPTLNQNTSGTASNLSGTPALPNGTTATTQSANDNSTKLATTAYSDARNTQVLTITNKRNQPRTYSTASTSTLTPDLSAYSVYYLTAQAAALTIANPIGTPVIGEVIAIYVTDNGTSWTLTFGSEFKAYGAALPTATTISETLMITAQFDGTNFATLTAQLQ